MRNLWTNHRSLPSSQTGGMPAVSTPSGTNISSTTPQIYTTTQGSLDDVREALLWQRRYP